MKKILSLILTLLVSLTSLTCLVYADKVGDYDVDVTLENIDIVKPAHINSNGQYQIDLKPKEGYAMPDSIEVKVGDTTLIRCLNGSEKGCTYTYTRLSRKETSSLFIYGDTYKNQKITVSIKGVEWFGEAKYTILDGNTHVESLFYSVGDGDYAAHDGNGNYTNTFGITETHIKDRNYGNYGMYLLPANIVVKVGDTTLNKCSEGETLGTNCDYTYDNNNGTVSPTIFQENQTGKLVVAKKYVDKDKTIEVTINLDRNERKVTGNIENGYFNGDTSKTGNVELNKICKADYYIDKNYKYTVQINANANYELPDTITVSGKSNTTEHNDWITFTDGVEYNYDKNTGKVTFNSNVFDYNSEFKIDAGTLKEEEKKASIVTCEDANGKGWIWSESKKACVYKVSNTSTKG